MQGERLFCAYWLISACAARVQCHKKLQHLSVQRRPAALEPPDTRVRHWHILKAYSQHRAYPPASVANVHVQDCPNVDHYNVEAADSITAIWHMLRPCKSPVFKSAPVGMRVICQICQNPGAGVHKVWQGGPKQQLLREA